MRALALVALAAAAGAAAAAAGDIITRKVVSSSSVTSEDTAREKQAIKSKLEGTEARVRELLADLETFSTHAAAAKSEIHTSLLDTWKNVELLARDRCGSELDSIRASQRKAEAAAADLQDELRLVERRAEELTLQLKKSSGKEVGVKTELSAERTRRETVEAEVHELRDKLHWASATANETRAYDTVATRLEALLLVVTERGALLQRVLALVADHHAGYEDWRAELATLGDLVRDADKGLAGDRDAAAASAAGRRISDLERRLADTQKARSDAVAEKKKLLAQVDRLRAAAGGGVSGVSSSASSGMRAALLHGERVVYQNREGVGIVGVLTACVMTLLCGAVLLLFCGWGAGGGGGGVPVAPAAVGSPYPAPGSARKGNAFTPDKPSGHTSHLQSSPVTYGSGQRQSTPRRY